MLLDGTKVRSDAVAKRVFRIRNMVPDNCALQVTKRTEKNEQNASTYVSSGGEQYK